MDSSKIIETELNWENLPVIAKRALQIVSTDQGFVTYHIDIESGSKLGDGYMSIIIRATINGTKGTPEGVEIKDVIHSFTVLCKMQVESKARREFTNSTSAFKREILLYTEYLPALEKLQLAYGINGDEGFYNYPKCFYAEFDEETEDAILVMSDLRDEGYKLANKYKPLDLDVIEIVLKGLGRLHALSFALQIKRPDIFKKFEALDDIMSKIMVQPQSKQMWDSVFPAAINSLQGKYPNIVSKLEFLRDNIENEFMYLVDRKNSGQYSVVGHGDSWTNNFLFKFNSQQKPLDIAFIDWQISRYASPVLDLVYFLFTATDKETREVAYENLLHIYHKSFSAILKRFGEDPDKVFSFDVLKRELKKFGRFGLLMSICLLSFVTIEPDDLPDLNEAMEDMMKETPENGTQNAMMKAAEANSKRMEPRIRDIVLDFERLGT
uniref:CSON001338 protein n=1 Tax=Culicoides sonorensis TaxID=179676 RepID=A0A336LHU0_CULSO